MSHFGIEKALVNEFITYNDAQISAVPYAPPGEALPVDPVDNSLVTNADLQNLDLWVGLENLRNESYPVTLGENGDDEYTGIFQVEVKIPKGKGTAECLKKVDSIVQHFPVGKSMAYTGGSVTVSRNQASPGISIGNVYNIVISIFYYSRIRRPSI